VGQDAYQEDVSIQGGPRSHWVRDELIPELEENISPSLELVVAGLKVGDEVEVLEGNLRPREGRVYAISWSKTIGPMFRIHYKPEETVDGMTVIRWIMPKSLRKQLKIGDFSTGNPFEVGDRVSVVKSVETVEPFEIGEVRHVTPGAVNVRFYGESQEAITIVFSPSDLRKVEHGFKTKDRVWVTTPAGLVAGEVVGLTTDHKVAVRYRLGGHLHEVSFSPSSLKHAEDGDD
jgi:hypothetical protein